MLLFRHIVATPAKKRLIVLAVLLLHTSCVLAQLGAIETHFTHFYLGGDKSDIDPSFVELTRDSQFASTLVALVDEQLALYPTFTYRPLAILETEKDRKIALAPNLIFLRGIISRADIKRVEHFEVFEFVIYTNITFEFFNVQTGEIYYTRTLSGRGYPELPKNKTLSEKDKKVYFQQCAYGTVKGLIKAISEDYKPGILEGEIVKVIDNKNAIVNLGNVNQITRGMTLFLLDRKNTPIGQAVTVKPQQKLCQVRLKNLYGKIKPHTGMPVRFFGLNQSTNKPSELKYMVTGFDVLNSAVQNGLYSVDQQSLAQWLNDGLTSISGLNTLAPLLLHKNSKGDIIPQEAFWKAQTAYTKASGVNEQKIIGKRAFPDIMVRGLITHADVQNIVTPGVNKKILRLSLLLEFYNRRTREYLYSIQVHDKREEEIIKNEGIVYRDLPLEPSFRDLSEDAIKKAVSQIQPGFIEQSARGQVIKAGQQLLTFESNSKQLTPGSTMQLFRKMAIDNSKNVGEPFYYQFGMVEVIKQEHPRQYSASTIGIEDNFVIQKTDLLISAGNRKGRGIKNLQVTGWEVKGKKIDSLYQYDTIRFSEWLHGSLIEAGKYNVLPPKPRPSDMDIVESAFLTGEFREADEGEIIYQSQRTPDILVSGRLGLVKIDTLSESNRYKNVIQLKCGIELILTSSDGDTLRSKKFISTHKTTQQLTSKGNGYTVVHGAIDIAKYFDLMITGLIKKTALELLQE